MKFKFFSIAVVLAIFTVFSVSQAQAKSGFFVDGAVSALQLYGDLEDSSEAGDGDNETVNFDSAAMGEIGAGYQFTYLVLRGYVGQTSDMGMVVEDESVGDYSMTMAGVDVRFIFPAERIASYLSLGAFYAQNNFDLNSGIASEGIKVDIDDSVGYRLQLGLDIKIIENLGLGLAIGALYNPAVLNFSEAGIPVTESDLLMAGGYGQLMLIWRF